MEFDKFLAELKKLDLPLGEFAIFGSGPMAIRGLRDVHDLDIVVKPSLWEKLALKYPVENGDVIHVNSIDLFKDWAPWFEDSNILIDSADIICGLPYVKLTYVIEWKQKLNREKDKLDLELINNFLKKSE